MCRTVYVSDAIVHCQVQSSIVESPTGVPVDKPGNDRRICMCIWYTEFVEQ